MIKETDTAAGYDRWAPWYEKDGNPLIGLDETVFSHEFDFKVKGKSVIDLGCGTGRYSIKLAEMGGLVTGLDVSAGMVREAMKKADSKKILFICHDLAEKLPLEDGSFDFAVSSLVLEHIKDLLLFFKEVKRVCKKKGKIYITAMHPSMMLLDVQANFKDPLTGDEIRPRGYPNQISDFVTAILENGLKVDFFKEYFCSEELAKRFPRAKRFIGWPMLVVFKLRK